MKRRVAVLFTIMMLSLACACGQGDEQNNGNEADQEGVEEKNSTSDNQQQEDGAQKGTRSNPYAFTDEITIKSKDQYEDDAIVEYTLKLNEVWGSDKVKEEYPLYVVEDRVLACGQILVNCDATDDAIDFGLTANFITSTLNEEPSEVEPYRNDQFGHILTDVYSGGTYDVKIVGLNDGMALEDLPYLRIEYTGEDGNDASVWIELPDASKYVHIPDAGEEEAAGDVLSQNDSTSTDGEAEPQNDVDIDNQPEDESGDADVDAIPENGVNWEEHIAFTNRGQTAPVNVAGIDATLVWTYVEVENPSNETVYGTVTHFYVNDSLVSDEYLSGSDHMAIRSGETDELHNVSSGPVWASTGETRVDKLGMEILLEDAEGNVLYEGIQWLYLEE